MPDTLTLSTGLSFGLLAGIVSGVCYLVANGINWQKSEKRPCLTETEKSGVCYRCGGDLHGGVLPCICTNKPPVKFEQGAWFLRQVQKTISLMPWSISTEKLEQIEEEHEDRESDGGDQGELRNVRHFLESLSARLAGGPLDRTKVEPLYDHPAYLPRGGGSISNALPDEGSTTSAHAQLKRLVQRVIQEAVSLPALAEYAATPSNEHRLPQNSYEDLLATAILNKVIERYQTENGSGGRSSGIHSASASPTPSERSSPRSLHFRERRRDVASSLRDDEEEASDWEEGEVTDDALELPRRVPFPEFGGDIIHAKENGEREFDEVSGSDIQAVDGSWEENWLFQKKKIKTLQSVPVPMLVPNSNTDYRALIGDRDAEDTTDLSDNASDIENEEAEVKSDMKRVLDSKHIIGGKPKIDEILEFEPDSLTSMDGVMDFDSLDGTPFKENEDLVDAVNSEIDRSNGNDYKYDFKNDIDKNDNVLIVGVDSGPLGKPEFTVEEIHRTAINGKLDDIVDNLEQKQHNEIITANFELNSNNTFKGSTNTLNRHQLEGEYEETVALPVQRYADSLRRRHFEDEQMIPTRDTDPCDKNSDNDLIPGSIADRERKKWLNFVDMPNNPYSPEAIQKRLSAKSSSAIFDMITNKSNTVVEEDENKHINGNDTEDNSEIRNISNQNESYSDNIKKAESKSPSPRILKDVLAEEIPQFKRYGRDYYIREAKKSSGGRKKSNFSDTSSLSSMNKSMSLDNFDTEFASPGSLINQFNTIATNEAFNVNISQPESITTTNHFNNKNNEVSIEYEDVNDENLFSAQPVFVKDDVEHHLQEIIQDAYGTNINNDKVEKPVTTSPSNPNMDTSYVSTSSNEDSIKIYNVQTGEIVKSTLGDKLSDVRYETEVDSNDNLDIPDKNVARNTLSTSVSHEDGRDPDSVDFAPNVNHILEDIKQFEEISLPKVKELAKKFIAMETVVEENLIKPSRRKSRDFLKAEVEYNKSDKPINKQSYMHSLTARSISKQFREGLKLSMATPLKVPGGTNEVPEGIDEVIKEEERPVSPLPEPGTIKSKLAFFESLKSKFNTK